MGSSSDTSLTSPVIQPSKLVSGSIVVSICIIIPNYIDMTFFQIMGYNPLVDREIKKMGQNQQLHKR